MAAGVRAVRADDEPAAGEREGRKEEGGRWG